MLDIRTIELFVAVFEVGSITKAAEREHIAQPALTVRLQQLEDELKVKLFERSTRHALSLAAEHFIARLEAGLRNVPAMPAPT